MQDPFSTAGLVAEKTMKLSLPFGLLWSGKLESKKEEKLKGNSPTNKNSLSDLDMTSHLPTQVVSHVFLGNLNFLTKEMTFTNSKCEHLWVYLSNLLHKIGVREPLSSS